MPLDSAAISKLRDRARREVDEGLLPSVQWALAYEGEIVASDVVGDANEDTRYVIFSATKPFIASVVWQLIAEGKIDPAAKVVDYFPEFGANGKDVITVEQVMIHSSGFPYAPLGPPRWASREERVRVMTNWKLNWEPGTRYEYHPTSAHWVLAELIDRATGGDYRDELHLRVTEPLGLPRILGLKPEEQAGIATLVEVGEPASEEELMAAFGVPKLLVGEVTNEAMLRFNEPDAREVGVPGGGGVARAQDLALFYQGLLHNKGGLWPEDLLADVTGRVRNSMPDPLTKTPANRSLGLILAGDDGRSHFRGMGRTLSAGAFGHNGAAGQLAWGDPATGLSFGYCTNGIDRHEVREPRRGTAIDSLAGVCATA
jgi:CubicO group peptidase (beta-lactamase class C family)